jgi:hypothetical protein
MEFWGPSYRLSDYIFALEQKQRLAFTRATESLTLKDDGSDETRSAAQLAHIWQKNSVEQLDVFRSMPKGPYPVVRQSPLMREPTASQVIEVDHWLASQTSPETITSWLWFLDNKAEHLPPETLQRIVSFAYHSDLRVRLAGLQIIGHRSEPDLADMLYESGWKIHPDMYDNEKLFGSLALTRTSPAISVADLKSRIIPAAFGIVAQYRDPCPDALSLFKDYVKGCLATHAQKGSHKFGGHYLILDDAVDRLVERFSSELIPVVEGLVQHHPARLTTYLFDEGFLVDLLSSLLRRFPSTGAVLWTKFADVYDQGFIHDVAFELMPLSVPSDLALSDCRDRVLKKACTDFDLLRVATHAEHHGNIGWIIETIEKDLASHAAADIGRALVLSGFLDTTDEAKRLWNTTLSNAPSSNWLSSIHKRSQRSFQQNEYARHWLSLFLEERNRDKAFGYFSLFLEASDRRSLYWAPKLVRSVYEQLPETWRWHWHLNFSELQSRADRNDAQFKKQYCFTSIIEQTQAPWLR